MIFVARRTKRPARPPLLRLARGAGAAPGAGAAVGPLDGARILDAGCGVGMYTEQFRRFSPHVTGVEVDPAVAGQAAAACAALGRPAEAMPFADGSSTWSSRTRSSST